MEILIILIILLQIITLMLIAGDAIRIRASKIIVDTSGLIDGRIVELAKTGFITGQLLIPKYVLAELQLLADGKDSLKRERARYGLEIVRDLQDTRQVRTKVVTWSGGPSDKVDEQLLHDAKRLSSSIFTVDFNLQKRAEVEGIRVLNVNALSQSLRQLVLPGEKITLKIVQKGAERGQGVGYLDDGTMVVVDKASKKIGNKVSVEITRSLQTQAGRMMFAKQTQ